MVYIIYLQNILYKIWHKSKFFFLKASLILQLLNTNKNVFNIGVKYVRMEFVWFFFEKNLMHSNSHPLIPFFTRTHTHTHILAFLIRLRATSKYIYNQACNCTDLFTFFQRDKMLEATKSYFNTRACIIYNCNFRLALHIFNRFKILVKFFKIKFSLQVIKSKLTWVRLSLFHSFVNRCKLQVERGVIRSL